MISCSVKETDESLTISIDLDTSLEKDISFFDLFESVSLIPLETLDECLISEITRSVFYDDSYYIFDRRQQSIFVFDQFGKFRYKIFNTGRGPGEYVGIDDMTLNYYSNTIDVLEPWGIIHRYSMSDGRYMETIKISDDIAAAHQFMYVSKDTVAFYQQYEKYQLRLYDIKNTTTINQQIEMPEFIGMNLPGTQYPLLSTHDKTLNFFHPYLYSIFRLEGSLMGPKYTFDLGEYNFCVMNMNPNRDWEYYSQYFNSKEYVLFFFSSLETHHQIITSFQFNSQGYSLVYYKLSGEYYVLRYFSEGIMFPRYPLRAGETIYSICQPEHLGLFVRESMLTDKQVGYSDLIKDGDNPVIIKYEPII